MMNWPFGKYYEIAPDGGSIVGIYLWESVAAANWSIATRYVIAG
jgi:hypothetical protein